MRGVIKSELAEKRVRSVLLTETEQPRIAGGPEVEPEVDPELAAAQAEIERLSEALRLREAHVERLERAIALASE